MQHLMRDVLAFHAKASVEFPSGPCLPSRSEAELAVRLVIEEVFETLAAATGDERVLGPIRRVLEQVVNDELTSYPVTRVPVKEPGGVGDQLEAVADGIADSIVVLIRMALVFGIPPDRVWAEVDRSNMSKFGPGWKLREDGKILKSPLWSPPDLTKAIWPPEPAAEPR